MQEHYIEHNGEKIYFSFERKNIKNMNLKVDKNQNIIVSIPKRMSVDRAKEFIKPKINWIKKQQNFYEKLSLQKEKLTFENGSKAYLYGKQYEIKIIPSIKNEITINNINNNYIEINVKEKYIQNKEYIQKLYENWLKSNAVKIFQELVSSYQQKLRKSGYLIKISTIQIRKMKTRWGSCTPSKNKVVFNLNLIKTPMCCIEYVVLHELAHFKHQNHSKNFYNFISIFMPDWKERRRILNKEFGHIV